VIVAITARIIYGNQHYPNSKRARYPTGSSEDVEV
jgi:hypothetical protein